MVPAYDKEVGADGYDEAGAPYPMAYDPYPMVAAEVGRAEAAGFTEPGRFMPGCDRPGIFETFPCVDNFWQISLNFYPASMATWLTDAFILANFYYVN